MNERQLMRLGEHVAAQEDALPEAEPNEATRRFLAEHAARRLLGERAAERVPAAPRSPSVSRSRWFYVPLAALLLLALFALEEVVFWNPPLSFTVGASTESGVLRDWESAPPDATLPIRFSDGTSIELLPNAQARVVAVGRAGAEIVIESGRAHVNVVPVARRFPGETPWLVNLGPFSVEVKGTRFDVGWDPHADDFSLELFEGSVTVRGCQPGQSHTLVAGQGVRASCGKSEWTVTSLSELSKLEGSKQPAPEAPAIGATGAAADAAAPAPAVTPDPEPTLQPERATPSPKRGARTSPNRAAASWPQLAREGHYAEAFELALDAGFERECQRARARDLVLLGDTARLRGDITRAEQAYSAARRRFPRSAAAAGAAFALGRLSVDAAPDEAVRWFEVYLRELPSGPLAASADDWLFELAARAGNAGRLRTVAETYLQRQPDGAHAQDARRILDADTR